MSRKKKTGPMWTEVENPVRLKSGDIVLWPKETGPVKHLHGSESTMRKLGFSIGRGRLMSYRQMEFLQAKSDRDRLFMVWYTHTNQYATDRAERIGITGESPIVAYATAVEIPLDRTPDTPADAVIPFVQSAYRMENGNDVARNGKLLGDDGDHIGSDSEDFCLQGLMDMRARYFRNEIAFPGGSIESTLNRKPRGKSVYDRGMFEDVVEDSFAALVRPYRLRGAGLEESSVSFNAKVLQNAGKYGMKIYRPSPKMREELVATMMTFSLGLIAERNRRYLDLTDTFLKCIRDFRKRLIGYTAKAHGLAQRNLRIATPTLKALSEITGSFPDCTSLTSEGAEK